MVRFTSFRVSVLFLMFLFLAVPPIVGATQSVSRITPQELNRMLATNQDVVIYDVRGNVSDDNGVTLIKGAERKALADFYRGEGLPEDKGKEIVTYCT